MVEFMYKVINLIFSMVEIRCGGLCLYLWGGGRGNYTFKFSFSYIVIVMLSLVLWNFVLKNK